MKENRNRVNEFKVIPVSLVDGDEIAKLWGECFGDEAMFPKAFVKEFAKEERVLCIKEKGHIVSSAAFLCAKLKCGNEAVDALYVYAVATLKDYRKLGLATKIIEFAKEKYGLPMFLCAASDDLEDFYSKMGFKRAFKENSFGIELQDSKSLKNTCDFKTVNFMSQEFADEYFLYREERLRGSFFVSWDTKFLKFFFEHYFKAGIVCKGGDDYILAREEGGRMLVDEYLGIEEKKSDYIAFVGREKDKDTLEYLNRGGMLYLPKEYRNWEERTDGYLALPMD